MPAEWLAIHNRYSRSRGPFRQKAEREAESLPSIGSSHVRSTLPSRVVITRGENAWVGTGKVISRTFAVVDA